MVTFDSADLSQLETNLNSEIGRSGLIARVVGGVCTPTEAVWFVVRLRTQPLSSAPFDINSSSVDLRPTKINRGSTFAMRRSTLDFCLGGQRSESRERR